ncbi:MAG: PAS domain S-box protein [Erysipelotrichaceae bacterium]
MKHSEIIIDAILKSDRELSYFVLDRNFCYVEMSDSHRKRVRSIWGFEPELNQSMLDAFIDHKGVVDLKNKLNRVLNDKEVITQIDARKISGIDKVVFIETTWSPLIEKDKVVGIVCIAKDLTESVTVKNNLLQHETIFESFFNQNLDGSLIVLLDKPIVWNNQINKSEVIEEILDRHKVIRVNQAYLNQYGYYSDQILNRSAREIFKDRIDEIREFWLKLLEDKQIIREIKQIRKNCEEFWVKSEYHIFYDDYGRVLGYFGSQQDISIQISMEDEFKRREASLMAMFEQAAVGMSYGPHKLLTNVNQKYCDIVGYSKDELKQMTYIDVTHPEDVQKDVDYFEQLLKGEIETYTIEKRLIRKNKEIIWINLTVSIVPQAHGEIYVLAVIDDISDRKNAEIRMNYLNYHDQLTGCYNRRYYEESNKKLDQPSYYPLSLVMVDADGLKLVNDALGHLYGDQLLILIANVLKETALNQGDVYRIGGDEFILTLPNTSKEEALKVIDKIHSNLKNQSVGDFNISVSCGCATKTHSSQFILDVFSEAEDVMYREKLLNSQNTIQKTLDHVLNILFERSAFERTHASHVVDYCHKMAEALGYSYTDKEMLLKAAFIHDIGKIGIDPKILEKKDKLNEYELKEMHRHSEIGYRILNSSNHFSDISMIVLAHHEKWDGTGYPKGLKGKEIPEYAQIIALSETYDVLISKDSYKEIISRSDAFNELLNQSGKQFNPELVIQFVNIIGKSA